jgi:hypothetical protein
MEGWSGGDVDGKLSAVMRANGHFCFLEAVVKAVATARRLRGDDR